MHKNYIQLQFILHSHVHFVDFFFFAVSKKVIWALNYEQLGGKKLVSQLYINVWYEKRKRRRL